MSKKRIIRITEDWTKVGDRYIRVRKPPLKIVPLSSLNKTPSNKTPSNKSGWI